MIFNGIPYYYIVVNGEKVAAALIPDENGNYFKENFLCKKTPEFFMHLCIMENLGCDRFVWPAEPKLQWVTLTDILKKLEMPVYSFTDSGVPLFLEFPSVESC
jgi:hypothetical protein